MPNIIDELGIQYSSERFGGCFFFTEDKRPAYINTGTRWNNGSVPAIIVEGNVTKPTTLPTAIPNALGWRMAAEGRYLVHLSRNNHATINRAVSNQVLRRFISPATQFLQDTDNISTEYYSRTAQAALMVMRPEYTSLKDGVEAMRAGELFSFCSSPVVAVIPDMDDSQAIYFNTHKAATLDSKGTLHCKDETLKRYIKEHL
jgi:hypothetical protein